MDLGIGVRMDCKMKHAERGPCHGLSRFSESKTFRNVRFYSAECRKLYNFRKLAAEPSQEKVKERGVQALRYTLLTSILRHRRDSAMDPYLTNYYHELHTERPVACEQGAHRRSKALRQMSQEIGK